MNCDKRGESQNTVSHPAVERILRPCPHGRIPLSAAPRTPLNPAYPGVFPLGTPMVPFAGSASAGSLGDGFPMDLTPPTGLPPPLERARPARPTAKPTYGFVASAVWSCARNLSISLRAEQESNSDGVSNGE